MSPLERYTLDSTGVLIRRQAINAQAIDECRAYWLAHYPRAAWKFPLFTGVAQRENFTHFWDWLQDPQLLAPATELCGEHLRCDHAFGVYTAPDAFNAPQLHGGPDSSQFSCFYHNVGDAVGLVGQLSVGVCISGQTPETGGFCYIPGSHKAYDRKQGKEIYLELLKSQMLPDVVTIPRLAPGDVIFFSESLVHGDSGASQRERLAIYYKFSPGWMCWRDPAEMARAQALAPTPLARRLLEPPWTGRFDDTDDVHMSAKNTRRVPTHGNH